MLQALHAEWQKARRRHDLVLCLTFAVILYLWLGSTAPTGQDELANAYSALFFGAPIINTILLGCGGQRLYSQTALPPAKPPQFVLRQGGVWAGGNCADGRAGSRRPPAAGAHARLHRGLSCRAVCLPQPLHADGLHHALLFGAAAGAVVQQSPILCRRHWASIRASSVRCWVCSRLLCRRSPAILCPGATLCRCAATRSRSGTRPATPYFTARGPATGGCWYLPLGWRSLCLAFAGA